MNITIGKLKKYILDADYRFLLHCGLGLHKAMPDEKYLKQKFKAIMKYELNLDAPKTFNEKIQWLKLHDRKEVYHDLVDKYEVRKHIAQRLGEQYLVPILGVWETADEVDFENLPDQFVLKPTHLSGHVIICREKNMLNREKTIAKMRKWLKNEHYSPHREWPYKGVKPRIIAEMLIEDQIVDYKFYCFNGEPKLLYLSQGLEDHSTAQISFFDLDFNRMPFSRSDYRPYESQPEKPENFDKMLCVAKELAKDFKFMRVDLYCVNGSVFFSELTFHPSAGYLPCEPASYDLILGDMLDLG